MRARFYIIAVAIVAIGVGTSIASVRSVVEVPIEARFSLARSLEHLPPRASVASVEGIRPETPGKGPRAGVSDLRGGQDKRSHSGGGELNPGVLPEVSLLAELVPPPVREVLVSSPLLQLVEELIRQGRSSRIPRTPSTLPTELPPAIRGEPYCVELTSAQRLVRGVLPLGLFFDRPTGRLCGTPREIGIFRFTVETNEGFGALSLTAYRLVVAEPEAPDGEERLRILTDQLSAGQIGAEYVFPLAASGGTPPLAWEVSGLPDGLEFDPGSGIIAGTPAVDGESIVSLAVSDSKGETDARELALLVRVTPIFITTSRMGDGVVGEPYQARLAAQGGVPPYRWEISPLPAGLGLDVVTGVIEGSPAESREGTVRVRVIDSLERSDAADLPFEIRPTSLGIVTRDLADGFQGAVYSFPLRGEGGVPPYSWQIFSGALPSGLQLDPSGVLKGLPAVGGEFMVRINLSDSSGANVFRRFRLRVQENVRGDADVAPSPSGGSAAEPDELPSVATLEAIGSDRKVGLVWQNPAADSYQRTLIVRSGAHFPETIEDGELVYEGVGNNTLDTGLENGKTYFYSAFADHGSRGVTILPTRAKALPKQVFLREKPDPFIDRIVSFEPLDRNGCFNCSRSLEMVVGPPKGMGESHGSLDVVALGARVNVDNGATSPYGGEIIVEFTDNIVANGPGADFIVFENAFRLAGTDLYFIEPAVVEVSVDGVRFFRFPFDFAVHSDRDGTVNPFNPFCYARGFAGVQPVYSSGYAPDPRNTVLAGGDQFDLSDLPGADLSWIRFIRIVATGDGWLQDDDGDVVRHSNSEPYYAASGRGNSGFDLDAVVAVHY